MDTSLFLTIPPPLCAAWLAHEKAANLLAPKPIVASPAEAYSARCKALNAELLGGRYKHLASGLEIEDFLLPAYGEDEYRVPVRKYVPAGVKEGGNVTEKMVIYYHGGGLYVGDLDSEDLTCRRIALAHACTVYSVNYRLMPAFTADHALSDAEHAFIQLTTNKSPSRLILAGSSSGGQLAAQVSQMHLRSDTPNHNIKIHGVLLRGPVTCNASNEKSNLPAIWHSRHYSLSPAFHTSLVSDTAVDISNRTTAPLPLEVENLEGLPKHWIQVSTNDIYYSDGVCYAAALMEKGVEVKADVEEGMPHTYWLKAPFLERAAEAEAKMLEGMGWLLEA